MNRKARDIILDGTSVRIWDGTGEEHLIMLHGIGGNKGSFDTLAINLPESWTLIAWDAPGYGKSTHLLKLTPDASDYAARLKALLDALNITRFLLLGHSLGTLIAVRFTSLFPLSTKGLILLASAQGYGVTNGILPEKAQSRLDDIGRLGTSEFAKLRADRLIFRPELYPEIKNNVVTAMAAVNLRGYSQAVHMLASGNLKADAGQISISSLVIVGADDVITPPVQSKNTHHALCGAASDLPHVYLEIGNAGHVVHQQNPVEVTTRIVDFACTVHPALAEVRA